MAVTLALIAALRTCAWILLDINAKSAGLFWSLQLAEGGASLLLSIALGAATAWLVRRRVV